MLLFAFLAIVGLPLVAVFWDGSPGEMGLAVAFGLGSVGFPVSTVQIFDRIPDKRRALLLLVLVWIGIAAMIASILVFGPF
jgi:hypothetical protein